MTPLTLSQLRDLRINRPVEYECEMELTRRDTKRLLSRCSRFGGRTGPDMYGEGRPRTGTHLEWTYYGE
jgi:hypothetical protein